MRKGCKPMYNATLFLLLLAFGCKGKVGREELSRHVSDPANGLHKVVEVNGTTVSVTYRPSEALVHQRHGALTEENRSQIDEEMRLWEGNMYFKLSLSRGDRPLLASMSSHRDYSAMIQTLSFSMGDHLLLVHGTDTLQFLDAQLARTYGKGYSDDMLLSFKRPETLKHSLVMTLEEFGLNTGMLRFHFKVSDIKDIPTLY